MKSQFRFFWILLPFMALNISFAAEDAVDPHQLSLEILQTLHTQIRNVQTSTDSESSGQKPEAHLIGLQESITTQEAIAHSIVGLPAHEYNHLMDLLLQNYAAFEVETSLSPEERSIYEALFASISQTVSTQLESEKKKPAVLHIGDQIFNVASTSIGLTAAHRIAVTMKPQSKYASTARIAASMIKFGARKWKALAAVTVGAVIGVVKYQNEQNTEIKRDIKPGLKMIQAGMILNLAQRTERLRYSISQAPTDEELKELVFIQNQLQHLIKSCPEFYGVHTIEFAENLIQKIAFEPILLDLRAIQEITSTTP